MRRSSLLLVLFAVSCIAPTNPLDPDASVETQAKANVIVRVVDVTGAAIDDVTITVIGGDGVARGPNGAVDGAPSIEVPAGAATLTIAHVEYQGVVRDLVLSPAETRQIDVVLIKGPAPTGTITGIVDLVGRADDSGVLVVVSGQSLFALTGLDGAFSISGVPIGTHEIAATLAGFSRGVQSNIDVRLNETTTVPTLSLLAGRGTLQIDAGAVFTRDTVVDLAIGSADAALMRISEDPSFTNVDATAYAAATTFTLSNGDGLKTVFVELSDAQGAIITILDADIVLDTTAPADTAISVNGGASFTSSVSITAQLSAVGATEVQLATDGAADTEQFVPFAAALIGVLPSGDGAKNVCARFRDPAGNVSAEVCAQIVLDTTPPTAPLILPGDGVVRANFVDVFVEIESVLDDATAEPVTRYEMKDGDGRGFREVVGTGPFRAVIDQERATTQICVRGIDDANNVSIEDCVLVRNLRSRNVIEAVDRSGLFDFKGDYIVFHRRTGEDEVVIRDLRGVADRVLDPDPLLTCEIVDPEQGFGCDLRPTGQHLRVDALEGNLLIATWETVALQEVVTVVALANMADLTNRREDAELLNGVLPDIGGGTMSYFVENTPRIDPRTPVGPGRIETRRADLPSKDNAPVVVSDNNILLCLGVNRLPVSPRVFGNTVVWCQLDVVSGTVVPRIMKGVRGQAPTVMSTLPAAEIVVGGLDNPGVGVIVQPVVSERFVVWVEGAGNDRVLITDAEGVRTNVPFGLDVITDMSGSTVVGLQANELTNDVAFINLDAPQPRVELLTRDLQPQSFAAIDGARIAFRDTVGGEHIVMNDRTNTRWFSASRELDFEPVTSTTHTAWLTLRNDEICIVAQANVDGGAAPPPLQEMRGADGSCERAVFEGPAEADTPWAIGDNRLVYAIGNDQNNELALVVRSLDVDERRVIDKTTIPSLTSNPSLTFTIAPDGKQLAWVADGTNPSLKDVLLLDLDDPNAVPVVVFNDIALSVTDEIPYVDVDGDMVVIQIGSRRSERNGPGQVMCRDGSNAPQLVTIEDLPNQRPFIGVRGPKIAEVPLNLERGTKLLAFVAINDENRGEVVACPLLCNSTALCQPVPLGSKSGDDRNVRIARDGNLVYLSSEVGLRQAVLVNAITRSRFLLANGIDLDRSGADIAVGRAVWNEFQLGDQDVWVLTLPK